MDLDKTYTELYESNKKFWEGRPIDRVFPFPGAPTTRWERFKLALEKHIEYLKEMEAQDPNFRCDCKVCRMAWMEEDGMD